MNNRELKFRAYSFLDKSFYYFDIYEGYPQGIAGGVSEPQQYTGLKDKNGKEIYEGDIFKSGQYKWDAVEFMDGKFIVNLQGARVFDLNELCNISSRNYLEVVGNICENSELAK